MEPNTEPKKYAVLIGIDFYLSPGMGCLHGCVNDIERTEKYLSDTHTFEKIRILKSTSESKYASRPNEPESMWPTRANIIQTIDNTIDEAKAGDSVYIHYSGHGSREPTVYGDLKADGSKKDEILVPFDYGVKKDPIRDLEFMLLLYEFVKKRVLVTVVLDCCHSGGAMRGQNEHVSSVRGVDVENLFPNEMAQKRADPRFEKLAEQYLDLLRPSRRGVVQSHWAYEQLGYTLLGACQVGEYEDIMLGKDGKKYGRLTNLLLDFLTRPTGQAASELTPQYMYRTLVANFKDNNFKETPVLIEGTAESFFGHNRPLPTFAATVREVKGWQQDGTVTIDAGKIHSIFRGTKYGIFPYGVNPPQEQDNMSPVATVNLSRIGDYWSSGPIKYEPGEPSCNQRQVKVGCQARLLSHVLPKNIYVQRAPRDDGALDDLCDEWDALTGRGVKLHLMDCGKIPDPMPFDLHYLVDIDPVTQGFIVKDLKAPEVAVSLKNRSKPTLVASIQHLARFSVIKDLKNLHPRAKLKSNYAFRVEGEEDVEELRIRNGQDVRIEVENKSNTKSLYLCLFSLTAKYSITRVFPTDQQFETIPKGETKGDILTVDVPYDPTQTNGTIDTVMALIMSEPVALLNFMELPELHENMESHRAVEASSWALSEKFSDIACEPISAFSTELREWQTERIDFRVVE